MTMRPSFRLAEARPNPNHIRFDSPMMASSGIMRLDRKRGRVGGCAGVLLRACMSIELARLQVVGAAACRPDRRCGVRLHTSETAAVTASQQPCLESQLAAYEMTAASTQPR